VRSSPPPERGEFDYKTFKGGQPHPRRDLHPVHGHDGPSWARWPPGFDLTRSAASISRSDPEREDRRRRAHGHDIAGRLSAAAEELSAQIEESSAGTENQRSASPRPASAVEQMNVSIMEVAKNSSTCAANAEEAQNKAQDGADVVRTSIKAIETMRSGRGDEAEPRDHGKQAEGIGSIIASSPTSPTRPTCWP
jgi:hypothetical protein